MSPSKLTPEGRWRTTETIITTAFKLSLGRKNGKDSKNDDRIRTADIIIINVLTLLLGEKDEKDSLFVIDPQEQAALLVGAKAILQKQLEEVERKIKTVRK